MTAPHKTLLLGSAFAGLLVIANLVVAFPQLGRRAGTWYRWVCPETGAKLSYNPGIFGSARLTPGVEAPVMGYRWQLVEPEPLSPLLPWNWLALIVSPPLPEPEAVMRQQRMGTGHLRMDDCRVVML